MNDTAQLRAPETRQGMLRVLSLGAGVQSTTLALMAAHGEITPMPDCAIFADTGAEPSAVYEHLCWLASGNVLPFPVHVVRFKDGLTKNIEASVAGGRFAGAPFFAETGRGAGMLRRQCTREFKIQPIVTKVRELVGLAHRQIGPKKPVVEQWIGISLDEAIRAKSSRVRWITHRWPLLEKRMHRRDCLNWLARRGYPRPPRSACVYCPYRSNEEWRALRDSPLDWAEAQRVDALIRTGVRGTRDPLYAHRSLKPLAEVDLSTDEDRGQISMFVNDCEGMCGV